MHPGQIHSQEESHSHSCRMSSSWPSGKAEIKNPASIRIIRISLIIEDSFMDLKHLLNINNNLNQGRFIIFSKYIKNEDFGKYYLNIVGQKNLTYSS